MDRKNNNSVAHGPLSNDTINYMKKTSYMLIQS